MRIKATKQKSSLYTTLINVYEGNTYRIMDVELRGISVDFLITQSIPICWIPSVSEWCFVNLKHVILNAVSLRIIVLDWTGLSVKKQMPKSTNFTHLWVDILFVAFSVKICHLTLFLFGGSRMGWGLFSVRKGYLVCAGIPKM